jgi:hypothetical protein
MHNVDQLRAAESRMAQDLKQGPQGLAEVFKELRTLRMEDGSEQSFLAELAKINKDLQSMGILPNLELAEDPQSSDGFSLRNALSTIAPQDTGNAPASSSAGGDGSSGGGSAGSASGAGGSFDGGGSRAGGSGSSAPAGDSSVAPSDLPSDIPSGSLAAQIIQAGENVGGKEGTVGMCLKGVEDSLQSIGINMPRRNYASEMAPDFANDKRFQEINANGPLQPGDIIVHGGTAANPAGHIAIVLPNAKESSDHIQNLISTAVTKDFGQSRVFRPVA